MSLNGGQMGLGFILWAQDMATGVFKSVQAEFHKLDASTAVQSDHITRSFKRIGTAIAVLTAGIVPLGAALATAGAAGSFVQGLAAVSAASGATSREMSALHDAAIRAGVATQFSPSEAVSGLVSLATAGQTAAESMRTLRPTLDLAAASLGQLDVGQAADALVGTLNSFGWGADQAERVTDKLVKIGNLTNFAARDMSVGLARAVEAGVEYNQSLDDVLIGMGLLRNRNIAADVASTALRNAMIRVNSDRRSQDIMREAGIPLLDAYTGRLRSVLDVMSEFADKTQGMDPLGLNILVKDIFGEEGMPAFTAIANASFSAMEKGVQTTYRGASAIAALRKEIAQSDGAATDFVTRYNDNFKGQLTLLHGSILTLRELVGEVFGEVLKPLITKLAAALNACIDHIAAMPMPVKKLAASVFLLAAGGLAIAATVGAFAALSGFILSIAGAAGALLSAAAAGLAAFAWPITLAIGAIAAFVAAYRMHLSSLSRATNQGPGLSLKLFWQGLGQLMETGAFRGDVLRGLNASKPIKEMVMGVYEMGRAFTALWAGIKDGMRGVVKVLSPVFAVVDTLLAGIRAKAGLATLEAGALLGKLAEPLSGLFRLLGIAIGAALGVVAAGAAVLVNFVLAATLAVQDLYNGTITLTKACWRLVDNFCNASLLFAESSHSYLVAFGAMVTDLSAKLRPVLARAFVRAKDEALYALKVIGDAFRATFANIESVVHRALRIVPSFFHIRSHMELTPQVDSLAGKPNAPEDGFQVTPSRGARLAVPTATAQVLPGAIEVRERMRTLERTPFPNAVEHPQEPSSPVNVEVQIDAETIARATHRANNARAARQFRPLVGY